MYAFVPSCTTSASRVSNSPPFSTWMIYLPVRYDEPSNESTTVPDVPADTASFCVYALISEIVSLLSQHLFR